MLGSPSPLDAAVTAMRHRRRVALIGAVVVAAVTAVAVLLGTSGSDPAIDANAAVLASSTDASTSAPTIATVSTTVVETVAPTTVAPTTTAAETTTTTAAPTTTVPTTVPVTAPPAATTPPSAPAVPVPPPSSNCSYAGAISISSINVLQTILAEATAFKDGLLCGNHRNDGVDQGVDILPGFASFDASVAGGDALVGQVPAIIFGHRKSHNRPFYNINKLRAGDAVVIHRLDGSEIDLVVSTVELHALSDATNLLLSTSPDGQAEVRLVACSHGDGTPGGVNYRWIATLVPA